MAYEAGDVVRLAASFKDADSGVAIEPSGVLIRVKNPSTEEVTVFTYGTDSDLVRDDVGEYHIDVSLPDAGIWHYTWVSTGTGQAAKSGLVVVATEAVPA